jgi:hypothetical protein
MSQLTDEIFSLLRKKGELSNSEILELLNSRWDRKLLSLGINEITLYDTQIALNKLEVSKKVNKTIVNTESYYTVNYKDED